MFEIKRALRFTWLTAVLAMAGTASAVRADFDIQFSIPSPGSFTPEELTILNDALARVENMWEGVLTGYQAGIDVPSLAISVHPSTSGLASASYSGSVFAGGFYVATSGFININVNEIENFANWQGVPGPPTFKPPTNLNYIDELLAHEVGHVLGVGTLWSSNGVYNGNYQYTGQHGLAAYRAEFDAAAAFVPVENAGNSGTPHSHWDQLMRSSAQEGNPNDPWGLDPRVFVTDQYGRDRGLEMLTGAIDPDWGEPFLSRFTVESMRDMGYTVAAFEDFNSDGKVNAADFDVLNANFGATRLEADSIRFGDADRDRDVDANDRALLIAAAPEPGGAALAALAALGIGRISRKVAKAQSKTRRRRELLRRFGTLILANLH
jgi:hypothetical protein